MPDPIVRNAARCRKCGDEIESRTPHHPVWCECQAIAVDGGTFFLRRIGAAEDIEEQSEMLAPLGAEGVPCVQS
jgi:hypothetical protein